MSQPPDPSEVRRDPVPYQTPEGPGQAERTSSAVIVSDQPYHLTLRLRRYAWWRPLLGLFLFGAIFVALGVIVLVATVASDMIRTGGSVSNSLERFLTDFDPLFLLGTNLSLAVAIPAAWVAMRVAHGLRFGLLSSVLGRLRWGLLVRLGLLALVVVVVFTAIGGFVPGLAGGDTTEVEPAGLATWLGFAVVVVLTTPLQAAGEEYVFRGYSLQVFGAWFRTPWVGVVVTSLVFAFAHGGQNLPLFIDRFAFGLAACWLVLRTQGLEAAIALHTMNNAVIFLLAAAYGEVGETLTVTEAPWSLVAVDVGQLLVFSWLADRLVRRRSAPVGQVTA